MKWLRVLSGIVRGTEMGELGLSGRVEAPLHLSSDKWVIGSSAAGSEVLFMWELTDNLSCPVGGRSSIQPVWFWKPQRCSVAVKSNHCNIHLLKCGKNVIWACYLWLIHKFKWCVIMSHLSSSGGDWKSDKLYWLLELSLECLAALYIWVCSSQSLLKIGEQETGDYSKCSFTKLSPC